MTASADFITNSGPLAKPAGLLDSGYIPITLGDITEWVFVSACQATDGATTSPAEVDQHMFAPEVQSLIARLAATFNEFFPMTAPQWEADLRTTTNPVTVLHLWNTVADVFDYYTRDRKLPRGARADYFRLIVRFFNDPGTCLDGITLDALTPGRAMRVVDEIRRFFRRHPASHRSAD